MIVVISSFRRSASKRLAPEISVINLSSLLMSSKAIDINFFFCFSSLIIKIVSTALLSEVKGFFISWETSAAKEAIASILFNKSLVISSREMANSPISSFRLIRFFISIFFLFLTLSAALANLLIGKVILFVKMKPKKTVSINTKKKIFINEY